MKHNLTIGVSEKPNTGGIVNCNKITVREKFLRFLFGNKSKLMILVPGDSVKEVSVSEVKEGGEDNG